MVCKCRFGFSLQDLICQSLGALSRVDISFTRRGMRICITHVRRLCHSQRLKTASLPVFLLREHINKQSPRYPASALCKIQKGQSILARANPPKIKWILLRERNGEAKEESDQNQNRTRLNKRAIAFRWASCCAEFLSPFCVLRVSLPSVSEGVLALPEKELLIAAFSSSCVASTVFAIYAP